VKSTELARVLHALHEEERVARYPGLSSSSVMEEPATQAAEF